MNTKSHKKATMPARPAEQPVVAPPPRWILAALVALYVVLTLALIARVPLNAAPDEDAHIQYVEYIAVRNKLPVFSGVGSPTPGYEYHQPPLYYLLCQPLWRLTGAGVQDYSCRLVSLLCGALTLILLWHAARALFPQNRTLPILATAFAALWPLHQGVGASASNDALAGLVCAGIFFVVARGARRPWRMSDSLLLGVLVGLAILSKMTCLVLGLVAAGAAWTLAAQRDEAVNDEEASSVMSPVFSAATVFGVAMLVGGWWLGRNQMLYGDPLGLGIFDRAFRNSNPSPAMFMSDEFAAAVGQKITLPLYLRALFLILFCTTWGIFGGPGKAISVLNPFGSRGPSPDAAPAVLPMLLCAGATVLALWGLVRRRRARPAFDALTRVAWGWWLAGFVLVALAWGRFNMMQFQAQARYFHPALLPMALFFALGWQQALGRQGRVLWIGSFLFGLLLIGLTLWNVLGWRTLV